MSGGGLLDNRTRNRRTTEISDRLSHKRKEKGQNDAES